MNRRPDLDRLCDDENLLAALDVAVHFRVRELLALTPGVRVGHLRRWAADAASAVGNRGDMLLFQGKRSGRAAEVFNQLAKGLAAAALHPGGIDFAGRHWEVDPGQASGPEPATPASRPIVDVDLLGAPDAGC